MLQKHFHVAESAMDEWPFWMFEENIKLVNEILEEEDKHKKKEEDTQSKGMPNFNPSSYMKDMNNMSNKFKP
jgi:hypothetical protein